MGFAIYEDHQGCRKGLCKVGSLRLLWHSCEGGCKPGLGHWHWEWRDMHGFWKYLGDRPYRTWWLKEEQRMLLCFWLGQLINYGPFGSYWFITSHLQVCPLLLALWKLISALYFSSASWHYVKLFWYRVLAGKESKGESFSLVPGCLLGKLLLQCWGSSSAGLWVTGIERWLAVSSTLLPQGVSEQSACLETLLMNKFA